MPLLESTFGAASRVGPYFSVTSLIPAAYFTSAAGALVLAQPWTGAPKWNAVASAITHVQALPLIVGALLTILLALVMHPLQFAIVQLLEGYWGTSKLGLRAAEARIRRHQELAIGFDKLEEENAEAASMPADGTLPDVRAVWAQSEALRARASYPDAPEDVMPTALGNVLRKYEGSAGRPYGLGILGVAPHLAMVAPKEHLAHLNDQRTQLDLATRLCITSALLTGVFLSLLAPTGWWMVLALVPYAMAVTFYRGACTVAHDYGAALYLLMDLNREALYTRLRLPPLADLKAERAQNVALWGVLAERDPTAMLAFDGPVQPRPGLWSRVTGRKHSQMS